MRHFTFAASLAGLLSLTTTLSAAEPLFPFVISYDAPANSTNVAHWLHRPAGKFGFVRVADGALATDDGPLRLWAANLCFEACFPSHEQAERLAARLARFGIGCVRFHHMDNRHIWGASPDKLTIDPLMLERLDYLIYQLKQQGIYSNLNLHVSRSLGRAEGFVAEEGRPNYDKGLDNFEPRMIAVQKQYARDLLTHVNPYTKSAYTDEPAIAFVEINNENALFDTWQRGHLATLPETYSSLFRDLWNQWLRDKYRDTNTLRTAWESGAAPLGPTLINNGSFEQPLETNWHLEVDQDGQTRTSIRAGGPRDSRYLHLEVLHRGATPWRPQLINQGFALKKGEPYSLSFMARSDRQRELQLNVMMAHAPWQRLGLSTHVQVEDQWREHRLTFIADRDDSLARITFSSLAEGTFDLAAVKLCQGGIEGVAEGESLQEDNIAVLQPGSINRTVQARRDFVDFLWDTEQSYWTGMYRYLKKDLQVRSLVCGTQLSYSPIRLQAAMDFVNAHAYWQHPSFPGRPWDSNNWYVRNVALVNSPGGTLASLAARRVIGKPYTVSEYNHPNPNQFAAEGFPMLAAFAGFQGWDALYAFAYAHNGEYEPRRISSFFDIKADTCRLVHMPACAALFVRGDVKRAEQLDAVVVSPVAEREALYETMDPWSLTAERFGSGPLRSLQHGIGMQLQDTSEVQPPRITSPTNESDAAALLSDTGQLRWDATVPGAGYFWADTPRTKLFTGFVHGRSFAMSGVTLTIGKSKLDWATVSLVCLDGQSFSDSGRVLIAATGWQQNQNARLQNLGDDRATLGRQWGDAPVLCEGIAAEITLPVTNREVRLFPLDESGNRRKGIVIPAASGGAKVIIGPQHRSVWYEVVIP